MDLNSKIEELRGVGPKIKKILEKIQISKIGDLLFYLPFRYEDESKYTLLKDGSTLEKNSFVVKIVEKQPVIKKRKGLYFQKYIVEDNSAMAEIVLFNQGFLDKVLNIGDTLQVYGKIKIFRGKISLASPKVEKLVNSNFKAKVSSIYPSTEGITSYKIQGLINQALEQCEIKNLVPNYLIKRYGLYNRNEAFEAIHSPKNINSIQNARNTLIFEEFLVFQLAIGTLKMESIKKGFKMSKTVLVESIIDSLPYTLTTGQKRAWEEIKNDLKSGMVMQRLVQGDVGSGKTILALLAIAQSVKNGYQALLMAPTEILAKQHMKSMLETLSPLGIQVELLTGSTPAKKKKEILSNVEFGLCDVLVGTHSLIEDKVVVPNLGLTITDEQHRFGVEQREKLQNKVENSHKLVMTATPIPRTLAFVLYGDMDISTIDTMPLGRQGVETMAISRDSLKRAFEFIRRKLQEGNQVYVVCPLIEENEKLDLDSAIKVYENLQKNIFPEYTIDLLHGKMKTEEKNLIMERFEKHESNILVSTTVIEVGVNVPNANVLLIYNAERFGLATLHQLRGRVGRGNKKAYCILYSESEKDLAWERLNIIQSSKDGFYIAEKDMELRGSGEFFGKKQSGLEHFRIGNPIVNKDIMKYAQIEAKAILEGGHLNKRELPILTMAVEDYKNKLIK